MVADGVTVVAKVARILEELQIPYMVGGSLASSAYGIPRATQDADLVADLRLEHVPGLTAALEAEFYVDAGMIRDAIARRASFNVIHLPTAYKADVFVIALGSWAEEEMARRRAQRIDFGQESVTLYFAGPEDAILHKLTGCRAGGGVSDRQWSDVLGVLKVQGTGLDFEYLQRWAGDLGVGDLLATAMEEAGLLL